LIQKRSSQFFALKVLKKGKIVKLQQLSHVFNEVKILSRVRCPFVVELRAVFQDEHSLYLLTDYLPGGELFSHLRRRERFTPPEYQFYSVELVCLLCHLRLLIILFKIIK
jgi:serine/threonine protein kinase